MTTTHSVMDSPVGPLTLRTDDGVLSGLYMVEHRHGPSPEALGERVADAAPAAREQLVAYFAGELREFDVEVVLRGTPFQQRVWAALREIPYGETCSYGELAAAIGSPTAVRAAGLANGKNPVSIIVPCHRVVGANGSLTGYGGGTDRKHALLTLEGAAVVRGEPVLFG
ncbi:methylated-DNA--[protein]-cysteine S-methyltransferase [Actinomycetospora sp. TBRC 11914]|uniref:methylated-DNA--[protein]-cysteine S-methyltransferase n=1 Tax=Actinomycetospora sp. TBRC 11914 TaxID=2729387 RepID=UPI00145E26FB|nr:methylated-DNA--[protein]-cysteine S-methyltransferase [Actinomycetospora sp. TBRC 11914]NMO93787.1 methylated-DNA--[protein]-cysteine S-methyltransferase [Actinomycetospora sp. TBRC 11914]